MKRFFSYLLCIGVFGHDWRSYDHWEYDTVGGGYVCLRCERGRPWTELSVWERRIADENTAAE